jgi:N-acylneuraminate cytidylyltransferase
VVKKSIAIILARGGSKRLPRKNILEFGGKPLLAWTISAAINSGVFDKILVSTDDDEIAEVGIRFGAEVPFLRNFAADDLSPSSEATYVALMQAEQYWSTSFDLVSQLMPNCPFRSSEDILRGMGAFKANNSPSQISCFQYGWMNPWWAVKLKADGRPEHLFPEALRMRSQDLPSLYCPTGALWIARRDAFVESRNFYMADHRFEVMNWVSALDIDDEEDLRMARMVLKMQS